MTNNILKKYINQLYLQQHSKNLHFSLTDILKAKDKDFFISARLEIGILSISWYLEEYIQSYF